MDDINLIIGVLNDELRDKIKYNWCFTRKAKEIKI